ncbi:MAG: UDP-N-acetyl-D-glucosamine dehydrogenase [Proteobacteria bacterium]|nr:UDP-N-acetyl-D-glucosamine dehydrogenase [Pseudomonadota bacterium]
MPATRVAVIGAGYLGRFHAQKYAALAGVKLVAVADPDAEARGRVAREAGCEETADYRQLLGRVDAVSVVTPTPLHHRISCDFLEAGAHVLVEKPITTTLDEARHLVDTAARLERVLQVGHLERFNPAIVAVEGILHRPRFVESNRLAPFKPRGTDVSVVLDLMIHDIDLILNIVGSPVATIDAVGASVFTDEIDIANARLRFDNGCVADATASRISMKSERKLRVFQADAYLSIDLQQKVLTHVRKGSGPPAGDVPPVQIEERSFDPGDALRDEIVSFLDCIATGRRPVVSGEDGLRALETAIRIGDLLGAGALAR